MTRHGNEKLQSKEQKRNVKKQRKLKGDLSWIHKKLSEGTRKQKPVTNDIDKLKTRANETEYWKKYNDNQSGIVIRFDNHMTSQRGGQSKIREFSYSIHFARYLFDYARVVYQLFLFDKYQKGRSLACFEDGG